MTFADDTSAVTIYLVDEDGNVIDEDGQIYLTKTASSTEIAEAQAAVDEAQAALDEKEYYNSSYGFFLWLAEYSGVTSAQQKEAATAAALLDGTYSGNITNLARGSYTYDQLLEALTIGEGVTALDNFIIAIEMVSECNSRRTTDDNFTGLSDLLISPVLMAISELHTNYSSSIYYGHTQVFYVGENLAWGQSSIEGAYNSWYTEEKAEYDAYGSSNNTGHYENIVNSSYTITGTAYTDVKGFSSTTWGQVFLWTDSNYGTVSNAYTVTGLLEYAEEYQSAIEAELEPLEAALSKAEETLAELMSIEVGTYDVESGAATVETLESDAAYTAAVSDSYGHGTVTCTVSYDSEGNAVIVLTDEQIEEIFEHSYTKKVTSPTCTEGGYTTYTCTKCSYSYTGDETEAAGHNYVLYTINWVGTNYAYGYVYCTRCYDLQSFRTYSIEYTEDASCTEEGTGTYTATITVGGQEITATKTVTIEATGHSWDDGTVTTEATCTEDGVITYTCGNDSSHTYTESIAATGHTAGAAVVENETAATCTEEGSYDSVVYCTVCNEELSRETVVVAATGHTAGKAVVENEIAATCETDGSYDTVVYCTVCGAEISRVTTTVSALSHDYMGTVTTAATCTEAGVMTYTCQNDSSHTYTKSIPATGHTAGEAVVENYVAPTCTEEGSYDSVVYCTVCGEELSRETVTVAATGHTAGEAVVENEVAATCTKEGSYESVIYCTVCGEELSREAVTVAATGHTYEAGEFEWNNDCSAAALTFTCSVCGDVQVIEAQITTQTTEPTCTQTGSIVRTAAVVFEGITYTDTQTTTLDMIDHTAVSADNAVEATCGIDGKEADTICAVCGEILEEGAVIPATGEHNYEGVVTKEATTTEEGKITYTCTVCGDTYTKTIAVLEEETTTVPESTEETTTTPESTKETTTSPEMTEETTTAPETTKETTTAPESTEETTTSPETTEETTTSPESTDETTTAPETQEETTTTPGTTEETTTVPESTEETTTSPETQEETTTSPESTEETTTAPETTEETTTASETTEETTTAPESTEETSSSGTGTEETSAEETTDALTDETETETESSAGEEAQAETETEAAAADGETAEAAADEETTEEAAADEDSSESPATGDSNGFAVWACMGMLAALALAFTALKRRFN